MKEYQKHTDLKKETTKAAVIAMIKLNISDYIALQGIVGRTIYKFSSSPEASNSKKNKKGFKEISKLLIKMAKHQSAASEGIKLYKVMFNETISLQKIVNEVGSLYFDKYKERRENNSENPKSKIIIPEDAPASVVEICNSLQKILKDKGEKDTRIEVIDLSDSTANFGFKMEDFPDFVSFAKAISAARKANNLDHEGKPGEDILNDAIIKNAENHTDDSIPKEKLN